MSKRDIFTVLMVGVIVGIFLGYAWRMVQIEPIRDKEIELFVRESRLLIKENKELRMEIAAWEAMAKQRTRKKMSVAY